VLPPFFNPSPGNQQTHPMSSATIPVRKDPEIAQIFKGAEARDFTADELNAIVRARPDRKAAVEAARAVYEVDGPIIERVVHEVLAQYPFEINHREPHVKVPRDVTYMIQYCVASMVADEGQVLKDRLLIWAKTILQSFDFPPRRDDPSTHILGDDTLEATLRELPAKTQSLYYCYYRVRQEMRAALPPQYFSLIEPYLTMTLTTLCEPY
jgi:hypothetical protein